MAKPVIEVGPDGTEYAVETGRATIRSVEERDRNAKVLLEPVGFKPKYDYYGWVDKEANTWEAAKAGMDDRAMVLAYRIEIHRDPEVDSALPWADVPANQRFRRLVALTVPESGAERPQEPSSGPEPSPSAPAQNGGEAATQPPQGAKSRGPRVQEDRPWEPFNTDGSLNAGSYAFAGAEFMVTQAHKIIDRHNREAVAFEDDPHHEPPALGQVKFLARRLLEAADAVQAAIRADGHSDRMDNSHGRARSAVIAAVWVLPPPFGHADADTLERWSAALVERATDLLKLAQEFTAEALA